MQDLIPTALAVWRLQEVQSVVGVFVWLCSINAMFWVLAKVAGAFVQLLSELFLEELWSIVATLYNIVLAVFFTAIIFVSATRGAPPGDLLWRQGCGFVLLYLALSAAYMDRKTNKLTDDSGPGYLTGLAAYIVFSLAPGLTDRPELVAFIALLKTLARSWLGAVVSAVMTAIVLWDLARGGLRQMFYRLSPFFWMTGMLKTPPIQIRREEPAEDAE